MKIRLFVVSIFGLASFLFAVAAASATTTPQHYYVIDQYPQYSTLFLYAVNGATVSFADGTSVLSSRTVPPDQIVSYPVSELGFSSPNFYLMEIQADKPFLANLAGPYSDAYNVRPPTELSMQYYFSRQESSPEDDELVIFSPVPTTVRISGHQFSTPIATTVSVSGVQNFLVSTLLGLHFYGYSIKLVADVPILAAVVDDGLEWADARFPFGLHGGELGLTSLATDYSRVAFYFPTISMYSLEANDLSFFNESGAQVGSRTTNGAESFWIDSLSGVGFPTPPGPGFIRVTGTQPFAATLYPTEQETTAGATYLGLDPSDALLGLQPSAEALVLVVNHLTGQATTLSLPANSLTTKYLSELGVFPPGPFVADIFASSPIYQEINFRSSGAIAGHVRHRLQQYSPAVAGVAVNGAGWILKDGSRATFGFHGRRQESGNLKGNLEYVDHSANLNIKSETMTALVIGGRTAVAAYNSTVNGESGYVARVTSTDNGEPGKGADTFDIYVTGPNSFTYSASALLDGGNIQVN